MFFFQIQFSRHVRQIGQELLHLRQSNRHTESVLNDTKPLEVARLNEGHNHVLKQSDDLNVTRLSPAHNSDQQQDQHIVCDNEVVSTTSDSRKLSVWYVKYGLCFS